MMSVFGSNIKIVYDGNIVVFLEIIVKDSPNSI